MTKRLGSYTHEYTERDLALYALGLGCGLQDLQYVVSVRGPKQRRMWWH